MVLFKVTVELLVEWALPLILKEPTAGEIAAILACIAGVNCLTSSALYEPVGATANGLLNIC